MRHLPLPVNVTICGLLVAGSAKLSVPLAGPVAVGENVTLTEQYPPAATPVAQELLEMEKPALVAMLEKVSDAAR
jgi:hypothetical protein